MTTQRKMYDLDPERVMKLMDQGVSDLIISQRMGKSHSAISQFRKRHGLPIKSRRTHEKEIPEES